MSEAHTSTLMHFYKIYRLDRDDNIVETALVTAPNDAGALAQAGRLMAGHDAEVWDQSRLVGRVPDAAVGGCEVPPPFLADMLPAA